VEGGKKNTDPFFHKETQKNKKKNGEERNVYGLKSRVSQAGGGCWVTNTKKKKGTMLKTGGRKAGHLNNSPG